MGLLPFGNAQVVECAALGEGPRLAALELADRGPLLGLLAPMRRDQAHSGHRCGRGSSRLRTAATTMHVEHELGERVELRAGARAARR
jgi:hypothetical protein